MSRLAEFSIDVIRKRAACGINNLGSWSELETGMSTECHYQAGSITYKNITCNAIGQFLRIQLTTAEPLCLCEVEVYGELFPAVALGMLTHFLLLDCTADNPS